MSLVREHFSLTVKNLYLQLLYGGPCYVVDAHADLSSLES